MTLNRIAWLNILSALGITVLVVVNVKVLDVSAMSYLALPVVWLIAIIAFILLREADRQNRERGDD